MSVTVLPSDPWPVPTFFLADHMCLANDGPSEHCFVFSAMALSSQGILPASILIPDLEKKKKDTKQNKKEALIQNGSRTWQRLMEVAIGVLKCLSFGKSFLLEERFSPSRSTLADGAAGLTGVLNTLGLGFCNFRNVPMSKK